MTDQELAAFPLLRPLGREAVDALAPFAVRHDFPAKATIIREGDRAESMFLLVRGTVAIWRPNGDCIGTLLAPTLFGEMALVATTPRLATVVTDEPSTAFEVAREAVFGLASTYPAVRDTILRFYRERLLQNVLVSNPLFEPLEPAQKQTIAQHLVVRAVPPGQVLLQEGQPGVGLYVLLRGRCEVTQHGGEHEVRVGELVEGDVFGEISMVLLDRSCRATVRTVSDAVVLFLPTETFQKTVMSNALAREALVKLALHRLHETAVVRARSSTAVLV